MRYKYIFLLVVILLLGGCAKEKELVCKKVNNEIDSSTESNYIVRFKDEKASKIIIQEIVTLAPDYVSFIEPYVQSAKVAVNDYKKHAGFSAKSSNANGTVTLTVEADTSKMSDDDKKQYNVTLTYDEYKTELESSNYGYTCE